MMIQNCAIASDLDRPSRSFLAHGFPVTETDAIYRRTTFADDKLE